jgi:hypothetical protein
VYDAEKKTLSAGGGALIPTGPVVFSNQTGTRTLSVERGVAAAPTRLIDRDGRSKPVTWIAEAPVAPSPEQLAGFAGDYYSDELDTTYRIRVESGSLVVLFRPANRIPLTPVFTDAFDGGGNIIRFTRDASSGRIDGLRIFAGRVRHLNFVRR